MRRFFLFAGIWGLVSGSLQAQPEQVVDSVLLHEVATYAPYKKYQAGAKVESVPVEQIEAAQSGGLDQLLMRFTPIYLKANAGGLSTIRVRGTAPDHTSVNFGGININSLTLGHSDFSSVPVYLFDGIDLQYGSSSAVNGSGSIGGAVYLGLENNWTNGARVKATGSLGSFGEQLYGAKVFVGNGKFESVTRLYYFTRENDFDFYYAPNSRYYTQRGAVIENKGLLQEFNYRFHPKEWLKSAIWLEHDWHEKQPEMSSSIADNLVIEDLDNKHIRFWSEYKNGRGVFKYKAGLGFVHDMQVDAGRTAQKIGTNRLIAELEGKQNFSVHLGYKVGVKYIYVKPDVYAYSSDVIDHEQRADLYASAFYSPFNRMKLTLNLRQQFVSNFTVPFTPSVGAEYRLFATDKEVLKVSGNVASSYRIPTFNDRFWGTQGNPDLNPEKGINYELGFQYRYFSNWLQSDVKLNVFYMDVDDWIEWRPTGTNSEFEAENRSRVVSKGIEFQVNNELTWNTIRVNLRVNYSFNPTEIKEDSLKSMVGQRLIYTPEHVGNVFLMARYRHWGVYTDCTYTGDRQVDYSGNVYNPDGNILDAYFLLNAGVNRKIELWKQSFNLRFGIRNLLDKNYQNQLNYAMPGRSFQFSLATDLKFLNNK
jgi:iron complex outermembrane receptor protein